MLNGVYYVKNPLGEYVDVVHIARFASLVGLTLPTARNLRDRVPAQQEALGRRRKLRTFTDGSSIWVPVKEVEGYPFCKGDQVYHYTQDGKRVLCQQCTFGVEVCEKNREAQEVVLPEDI